MKITITNRNWIRFKEDDEGNIIITFIDGNFDAIEIIIDKKSKYFTDFLNEIDKLKKDKER
jgi:hypothetical protein